eukprot:TRINITY_DN49314_c0_g1_i2.p1 TRINITY_DN49314_c0_g1~~TRINITY_DN49314_c0_g1_i2.p1  ORF type:complete len:102 (-),score=34.51 TRINITY_DN49314_c0_g1_i2:93-398(-)
MCIRDSINAEYGERLEVMVLLAPRAGVVEESEAEQIEITEQRVLTRLNTQLYYAQADLMNLNKQRKEQRLSLIHISEPTRLLSISYAVFCLKKKNQIVQNR